MKKRRANRLFWDQHDFELGRSGSGQNGRGAKRPVTVRTPVGELNKNVVLSGIPGSGIPSD